MITQPASLAGDLGKLLAAVAGADPEQRGLLAACPRCRNRMLYLMYPPGSDRAEQRIAARLRALPIDHEGHGRATHSDDAEPQLTRVPGHARWCTIGEHPVSVPCRSADGLGRDIGRATERPPLPPGDTIADLAGRVLALVEADVISGELPAWPASLADLGDDPLLTAYFWDVIPGRPEALPGNPAHDPVAWRAWVDRGIRVARLADHWIRTVHT